MNIGDKFNKLTFIKDAPTPEHIKGSRKFGLFKCDCGANVVTTKWRVKTAKSKSCGCLQKEHASRIALSRRQNPGVAAKNCAYYQLKSGAKKRGLDFLLSLDEFTVLATQSCHYCGCAPSSECGKNHYRGTFIYNGIDRIDNDLGYVLTNCVTCCITCNRMKSSHSKLKFITHIKKIYEKLLTPCKR